MARALSQRPRSGIEIAKPPVGPLLVRWRLQGVSSLAPSGGGVALLRAGAPSTATSWSGADASASAAAPASCREVTSSENICARRATARSMSSDFPTSRLRRYGMPYPEFKGLLYFRRPSFKLTRNSSRLGSSSSVVFQGRALRFAKCFLNLDFHFFFCDGANFARTHSTSFSGARARRNDMCKRTGNPHVPRLF